MSETEEIAKAVQNVAKFGEKSIGMAEKVGGFFARVFREPAEEVAGMITDKLRFARWRRLIEMADEVSKILTDRGVKNNRAVTPKLAWAIFEEASLEDDTNLQPLWNNLLANAMDPQYKSDLRYGFIDMIKNITGIEALILKNFYCGLKEAGHLENIANVTNFYKNKDDIIKTLSIDDITYQVSIYNLMRMQCIGPAIIKGSISFGEHCATAYKGTDAVVLTPLGVRFVEACIK